MIADLDGRRQIDLDDLKDTYQSLPGPACASGDGGLLRIRKGETEKECLISAMQRFRNNITQVAKALGVSRKTVHQKIKMYDITDKDLK